MMKMVLIFNYSKTNSTVKNLITTMHWGPEGITSQIYHAHKLSNWRLVKLENIVLHKARMAACTKIKDNLKLISWALKKINAKINLADRNFSSYHSNT